MKRDLITFVIETERFAIDVKVVREIRAWTPGTRLPSAPHYFAGVMNLRGVVIPVIDLAARIGWKPTEATERHAIIVIELAGKLCGLIVDEVSDIASIEPDAVQARPVEAGDKVGEFLEGLATIDDKLVLVLAPDALGEASKLVDEAQIAQATAA